MADEQTQGISTFLESVLDPSPVSSLREGATDIQLQIFDPTTRAFQAQTLRSIFPFMSIADVKHAIYTMMRYDDRALPQHIFLARQSKAEGKFIPVDYQWVDSQRPKQPIRLPNPAEQVGAETQPNRKFVDSNGERRILGVTDKSRLLVEEGLKGVSTLYVFFYRDLLATTDLPTPISEVDWNGRFWPYFPSLSISTDTPTADQRNDARRAARVASVRRQFFARLEESLTTGETPLPLALTGVRYLRLTFSKPAEFPGIERMFYEIPVSERRPYMRLMPADRTPISKIHLLPSGRPNLDDPRLLVQWSQERSATPERDYALAKLLYRKASGSISPLYFTMRLLDDGTADLTIEPPRGVRRLEPRSELGDTAKVIQEGLQGLAYLQTVPKLGNGSFIFGLTVKGEQLTTERLRKRMGLFKSVFQEIPPLPNETPLLMMRYKLVSNFFTEDRVGVFISQVMNRRLVRGDALLSGLVEMVAEEFDLEAGEAKRRVAAYLQDRSEVIAVDMESKDYQFMSNAGVDISVFAQHPLYAFHLYRVDSVLTLHRVITLLSLLFSRSPEELRVSEEAVDVLDAAEKEDAEEAEEDAASAIEGVFDFDEEGENTAVAAAEPAPEPPAEELPDYLQDFMFNADAADAADAPEDDNQAAVANDAAPMPTAAPEPPPPAPEPPAPEPPAEEEAQEELERKHRGSYEDYFSIKLKEADRRLFDYHKTHPSAKKYVTQCGSNLMRQPAVLTEAQYKRMMDEYDAEVKSGEVVFHLFPLKKAAEYKHSPGAEFYTIMRYGTDEKVKNYYLCCRFFCTRDYMLVREKDLRGTTLRRPVQQRDGSVRTTKAPMTCPFCEGKVIQNRQYPGVNEVILERNVKPGTVNTRHLYIKFLGKVYHPDGYHLPCCFTDDQPVRIGHPAFPEGDADDEAAAAAANVEEEAPAAADEEAAAGDLISYEETLKSIRTAYIIGAEKFPLEGPRMKLVKLREGADATAAPKSKVVPPQIGLLPSVLNSFFGQDPGQLVSRTFNPQKVKPGAQGFLRIGVENRSRFKADSFLAAVAPFFGKDSVAGLKTLLETVVQPRVFMAMNYGNFLLEMYDAATLRPKPEEMGLVREWARTALGQRRVANQELLIRAFMAYRSFHGWLQSDQTVKEYRHFAHLFLMPGVMATAARRYRDAGDIVTTYRRPGILFIVIDILKSGEIRVRCPPYPVSQEAFERADIGFLAHHWTGIWEPIFYVDNRSLGERDLHTFFLAFSATQRERWPEALKQRVEEFSKSCATMGGARGIFTSQSGIHSTRILPITTVRVQLAKEVGIKLHGIVRDAYNHVAALVYQIPEVQGANLVAVPVVDDGIALVDTETRVFLDWDEFEPAPLETVLHFYRNYITYPKFPKTYMPRAPIRSEGQDQIVAIRLEIGLFVPVAAVAALPDGLDFPQEEETVHEMEWMINRELAKGSLAMEAATIPTGDETRIKAKEFNEVYEHLRLTFSNWLASLEDGGEFRRGLETILFNRELPMYEKRKRLEIILGSEVESWLYESDETTPREVSLLRVDCRLRDQSECSGACSWRTEDRQCLLHVPKTSPLEGTLASGARVLLLRLLDELLRFAGKRRQLFEQRVSQLAVLENPVRIRDQYIVPEKSAAWIEMLRLEWAHDKTEEARYLEEMSRLPEIGSSAATTTGNPEDTFEAPAAAELPPDIAVEQKSFRFGQQRQTTTTARAPSQPTTTARAPGQYRFTRRPTTTARAVAPSTPTTTARVPGQYVFKRKATTTAAPAPTTTAPAPTTTAPAATDRPFRFVKPPPALAALPAVLKAIFGPNDPKTARLHLYPSPTGSINPFLGLFGVYPPDIGMPPRATEFTDEDLSKLVRKSRVPIVQYDLRTEPPTVMAKRLASDREAAGYPVIVIREDVPPSLVVVNPEDPAPLQRGDLPVALATQFQAGVKIFGIKLSE